MIEKLHQIGKELSKSQDEVDTYVEKLKDNLKDKKGNEIDQYIVKFIINLDENYLDFEIEKKFEAEDCKKYSFLKTPKGNSKNFTLVWGDKKLSNLTTNSFHSLFLQIEDEKDSLSQPSYDKLKSIVGSVLESKMYDKKNDNLRKDSTFLYEFIKINKSLHHKINEKSKNVDYSFSIDDDSKDVSNMYQKFLFENNKLETDYIKKYIIGKGSKIAFYYPAVIVNNEEISITKLHEYKELYLATKNHKSKKEDVNKEYCYICNEKKEIDAKLSFDRGSIPQIFVTTTISSAQNINKSSYKYNYSLCTDCVKMIKTGNKFIEDHFRFYLAEIPTYIIPYFYNVKEGFDYNSVSKSIKNNTELLFKSDKVIKLTEDIDFEIDDVDYDLKYWSSNTFSLTFLSYQSDGNSFKALNIINDISKSRFEKIVNSFKKEHNKLYGYGVKKFSLNSIYRLIPIKNNSDKKNPALEFYSSLFSLHSFKRKDILIHFTEALRYLYYLPPEKHSSKSNIYSNLYKNQIFDFTIKQYVFRYLLIFNALNNLNIIEKENFIMSETLLDVEEEKFLNIQKFGEQERALFFLGLILKKVGIKQSMKGHYTVPIMQKLQFQGMTCKDIQRLYLDLVEKVKQYSLLKYKTDAEEIHNYMKAFHNYFDKNLSTWKLSEQENVFYLLSGYAYKTGTNEIDDQNNQNEEITDVKQ